MLEKINTINNVLVTSTSGRSNGRDCIYVITKSTQFARTRIIEILEESGQEYFVTFRGEVCFTIWS